MMNLETALAVFRALEAYRYNTDEAVENSPIFDVRLDAGTDRDETRTYRVRVSTGPIDDVSGETWQFVLDVCILHDLTTRLANSAIEIF